MTEKCPRCEALQRLNDDKDKLIAVQRKIMREHGIS